MAEDVIVNFYIFHLDTNQMLAELVSELLLRFSKTFQNFHGKMCFCLEASMQF